MNFNGESVDNNAELDSKTQNIDLATTVALTTNFLNSKIRYRYLIKT